MLALLARARGCSRRLHSATAHFFIPPSPPPSIPPSAPPLPPPLAGPSRKSQIAAASVPAQFMHPQCGATHRDARFRLTRAAAGRGRGHLHTKRWDRCPGPATVTAGHLRVYPQFKYFARSSHSPTGRSNPGAGGPAETTPPELTQTPWRDGATCGVNVDRQTSSGLAVCEICAHSGTTWL